MTETVILDRKYVMESIIDIEEDVLDAINKVPLPIDLNGTYRVVVTYIHHE